jgi:short-subunit dehydrogenase
MPPVALITGASAGIGKEFAREYAARGYELVLVARREDALSELAAELQSKHGTVSHVVAADLADANAPMTIFHSVEQLGVHVDILVNNAGFGYLSAVAEAPPEKLLGIVQVNIAALVHLTRLFLPSMISHGTGGVLNVASTAAFVPGPLMAVYYASKAFVLSFSEALWNELQGTGVKASCLCPGATVTEFGMASGMDKTPLFARAVGMDAASVARIGVAGLERNEAVTICGAANRLAVASSRFVPRRLTASVVRKLQTTGK